MEIGLDLLEKHGVDALPVVEGTEFKGIFTWHHAYRDYCDAGKTKEEYISTTKIKDILVNKDVFLNVKGVYEKASVELNDFPIIAAVEEKHFLGIVTRYDLVNQLQSVYGMKNPGYRITFTSVESKGRIGRLGGLIEKYKESVIS